MNCAICGRALRVAAYRVAAGPVGPVCAMRAGVNKRKRRGDAAGAHTLRRLPRHAVNDSRQMDWVAEVAA